MKTEFHDRSGKPLYTGDILQYRLSYGGKRGGPSLCKVVCSKKGVVKLTHPDSTENSGWVLRKTYEKCLSIVDTSGREL